MLGDREQGLLYEQSQLPRVKVNTDRYLLRKIMDNVYFTRILKKQKQKQPKNKQTNKKKNQNPPKPNQQKSAKRLPKKTSNKKTHKPTLLLQKTLNHTKNTPKSNCFQFSFFSKKIKGEKAALVNQLPLLTLKQSFYGCNKQYLATYSFSFQQHWVHNVKMKDLSLVFMELTKLFFYFIFTLRQHIPNPDAPNWHCAWVALLQ